MGRVALCAFGESVAVAPGARCADVALQIFISSAHLGAFPSNFPSRDYVDWLPVDRTAKVLVELLMHSCTLGTDVLCSGTQIFHALNPHPLPWMDIAGPAVSLFAATDLNLEMKSFDEWLERVRNAGAGSHNPAFKLIDFYTGLQQRSKSLRWTRDRSMAASPTLDSMDPVNEVWIRNWMHQWRQELSTAAGNGRRP